ncbi:hypothetical protein BJ170DRAFT_591573 [Xylariales sp. AK1849]|nr:hypothetical protein BJ170DRAFT_591573 [Xylariales sp. AK1849]
MKAIKALRSDLLFRLFLPTDWRTILIQETSCEAVVSDLPQLHLTRSPYNPPYYQLTRSLAMSFTPVFAKPEEGFDPNDNSAVLAYNASRQGLQHTLGTKAERAAPIEERVKSALGRFEKQEGRPPTEDEANRIREKTPSGWLEGLKIDLRGHEAVPMGAFNRLAFENEALILQVARDKIHDNAKHAKEVLERDDIIKTLQARLAADEASNPFGLSGDIDTLNELQALIKEFKQQAAKHDQELVGRDLMIKALQTQLAEAEALKPSDPSGDSATLKELQAEMEVLTLENTVLEKRIKEYATLKTDYDTVKAKVKDMEDSRATVRVTADILNERVERLERELKESKARETSLKAVYERDDTRLEEYGKKIEELEQANEDITTDYDKAVASLQDTIRTAGRNLEVEFKMKTQLQEAIAKQQEKGGKCEKEAEQLRQREANQSREIADLRRKLELTEDWLRKAVARDGPLTSRPGGSGTGNDGHGGRVIELVQSGLASLEDIKTGISTAISLI